MTTSRVRNLKHARSTEPHSAGVKSARRALQIMALFHAERRPLTTMDISRTFDWPQSSTTERIQTLHRDGFLNYSQRGRTYFPSIQFGLLGRWVCSSIFAEQDAADLMLRVRGLTGHTVMLSKRNHVRIEVLDVISGIKRFDNYTEPGDNGSITSAVMGWTLLSGYDDKFIELLLRRVNSFQRTPSRRMTMTMLRPFIEKVRKDGFGYSEHGAVEGAIVTALIPAESHEDRLVIGVAGTVDEIRADQKKISEILRAEVDALVHRMASRMHD